MERLSALGYAPEACLSTPAPTLDLYFLASLCALLLACGAGVEAELPTEDLSCEASTDPSADTSAESRGDTSVASVGDIARGAGEGDGALRRSLARGLRPIDGWQPGAPLFIRKTEA